MRLLGDDLFSTPLDQSEIDFEHAGGETYICGNPPYLGSTWQTAEQKDDLRMVLRGRTQAVGFLDYVSGWFVKAADWIGQSVGAAAFVSTNSVCQGQSVPILWPVLFQAGCAIRFACTSFKWANLASNNAGVTVVVVGLAPDDGRECSLYSQRDDGAVSVRRGESITPYLTIGKPVIVTKRAKPLGQLAIMEFGNKPTDGGNLLLNRQELDELQLTAEQQRVLIRRIVGSQDFIQGGVRYCIWIEDQCLAEAQSIPAIRRRIEYVRVLRLASPDKGAQALSRRAHQLKLMRSASSHSIVVPRVSSERRPFLPAGIVDEGTALTDLAFGLYDAPLWNMAVVTSRLHLVWTAAVCGKMKTDFRYSNTLGWNTFPVPTLTDQNMADMTRCAEAILLARETHYPATIAELYDPDTMPADVRDAHERNDEVLERIYIGRRFRNDTERLEKLFAMYTQMTAAEKRSVSTRRSHA